VLTDKSDTFLELMTQFASDLERAADLDGAMDILSGFTKKIGFPMVDYAYTPVCRLPNGEWKRPPVKTRDFPPKWDKRWDRHGPNDPYYHACLSKEPWVKWSSIRQRGNFSQSERDCLEYLSDVQLVHGVTIPILFRGGSLAFVSGAWHCNPTDDVIESRARLLSIIAPYFHNTVFAKFGTPFQTSTGDLSPRERECITWLAQGKTAEETAIILGRSAETVRVHLKNSMVKLGATNCKHAISKAIFLGLVDL
jgi:LuxR family transcriptional regulator